MLRAFTVLAALIVWAPAAAQLFAPWESVITPRDRALLDVGVDRLQADVAVAAKAGKPYGIAVPALLGLLRAKPQAFAERDLLGDWRCRSIQVNELGIFGYPYFRCRVRATPEGLFFEKLSGSQRVSGLLFTRDPSAYVLLGGATVNEDPQRRYESKPGGSEHNRAGLVTRIGASRLRAVFADETSRFEVFELVR